tara:strand:- start:1329 stop:2756 length:1428 start_codon:yes stop_codon:yes gene_type:complete
LTFNSLIFLVFISFFFIFFFFLKSRIKIPFILLASYIFYSFWDWRFLGLILLSTIIDYLVGYKLGLEKRIFYRKMLLSCSILCNLTILSIFKYLDFFVDSFELFLNNIGLNPDWPTLNIVLPVGISFYTFQSLSYTIDVYRKQLSPEKSFLNFATYISMFPQLVAGPIVRATKLLPQIKSPKDLNSYRLLKGVELIVWGYLLKVVLADNLGFLIHINGYFDTPQKFSSLDLILATLMFSFQIYGDFAGYSLIAIGLAKILGFDLDPNFKRPYFASSFSEFWKRWHISLSSWLRDYLYISLGGNRKGVIRTSLNLIITMVLGGLWHGAALTFIIWGLLHGIYLIIFKYLGSILKYNENKYIKDLQKLFLICLVFFLTSFAWVFFRSNTLDDSLYITKTIFTFDISKTNSNFATPLVVKCFLALFFVLIIDIFRETRCIYSFYKKSYFLRILGVLISAWIILLFGNFAGNEFVYFQF